MKHVQIEGMQMIRDISNMSLINTDRNELDEYLNRRNFLIQQKQEINNLKLEIKEIRSDISEIKNLLIKNLKE
jgi:hypothetical protein